jgi:hypothetical protein
VTIVARWNRFWFRPGRAEDLAIGRIVFGAGLFVLAVQRPLYQWGGVPRAYRLPADWFGFFGVPIASEPLLYVLQWAWGAAILALTIGFFTRTAAALVCLGSLYLLGMDTPEFLGRSYTPAVFVSAILACSRCGDALSIDAWRRRARAHPEEYGWPATLICAFLAYTFFAAGVSKIWLTGFPDWMVSDMSYRTLLYGNYWYASRGKAPLPVGAAILRVNESFAAVIGILTQMTELLYPLALFARSARLTLVPLMLALLVGIAVAMGPFFGLTMLAHVFWVPWTSVLRPRQSEELVDRGVGAQREDGDRRRLPDAAQRVPAGFAPTTDA